MQLDWRVKDEALHGQNPDRIQRLPNFGRHTAIGIRVSSRQSLSTRLDSRPVQNKTDERSGITNDPNRADDPEYIVRLIKQVVTVSLETVRVVEGLTSIDVSL